tara:strand:+ start:1822 stop:2211 length:390 start_codon:yes stop_codon:yes gene_type:complete
MTNKKKFFAELKKPHNLEKFNLTSHKIMLNSVDVIREALDMTYFEDEVFDRIDEAQSKMIEARDIFRFDMAQGLGTAEDEINYLKTKLDELGVEYPSELNSFETEIAERESTFDEVRRRFEDMGYAPLA